MFIDLFRRVDDWLIDSFFQPICDWLRMTFDVSRRGPLAICEAGLASFSWTISINWARGGGDFILYLVFFVFAWAFLAASCIRLVMELTLGPPEQPQPSRFRTLCFGTRRTLLIFYTALWLAEVLLDDVKLVGGLKELTFFIWCEAYFLACSEHPKRRKPAPVSTLA